MNDDMNSSRTIIGIQPKSEHSVCPVCLGRSFETFIDLGQVPVTAQFSVEPEWKGRELPLSYEFCSICGLIRLRDLNLAVSDYSHFSLTSWRRPAPYIESRILPFLSQIGIQNDDLIIEVGANDGTFLDLLRSRGFRNLLAIEPSDACVNLLKRRSLRHEACHLDRDSADRIRDEYGCAGVVICRHTLEHVSRPDTFLRDIGRLLSNTGILLVEVPDARALTEDLRGYSLRPEHPYTYSRDNLEFLVQRMGFEVIHTVQDRGGGDDVILLWGRVQKPGRDFRQSFAGSPEFLHQCRTFGDRWQRFVRDMREQSVGWKDPVVCLGASYKQLHLLLFSGIGPRVSLLVDDNPDKVGRYAFLPHPVEVVSTQAYRRWSETRIPGTIIRGAFGYDAWMDTLCLPLRNRGIRFVDPFEVLKKKAIDGSIRVLPNPKGYGTASAVQIPTESPRHG